MVLLQVSSSVQASMRSLACNSACSLPAARVSPQIALSCTQASYQWSQPGRQIACASGSIPEAQASSARNSYTQDAVTNPEKKEAAYQVLFAIISKCVQLPSKAPLRNFLRSKDEAVSVPFILWVAAMEAKATGQQKQDLADICEELVKARTDQDDQRMDQLYIDTLQQLSSATSDPSATALALAASPQQYAVQLSEAVTGAPMVQEGFGTAYDVLLQVAPPAALTPEGVRQGHQQARELADEMRARRKRSVASLIGRAKLTPQQAQNLMAGSAASRIVDMLLSLPSSQERLACLPDCFTPPAQQQAGQQGPGSTAGSSGGDGDGSQEGADTEELWCTPSQLLNELDVRLRGLQALAGAEANLQAAALPAPYALRGDALLAELALLQRHVREQWLNSLRQ